MGSLPQNHNYTSSVLEYANTLSEVIHYESNDELEVRDDFSIKLPVKLLDELGWKTKTKIMIVEHDADLQEIIIGKKISGIEAVDVMHKIADSFI